MKYICLLATKFNVVYQNFFFGDERLEFKNINETEQPLSETECAFENPNFVVYQILHIL